MAGVEAKDFSAPDEVRKPDKTTVELVKLGGLQNMRGLGIRKLRCTEAAARAEGNAKPPRQLRRPEQHESRFWRSEGGGAGLHGNR